MKTLTEQYRSIKEDKGHKGVFLKEAKIKETEYGKTLRRVMERN